MSTYAVTGAARGIGFEIVRQLLAAPASKVQTVVAITRNKNSAQLNDLIAKSNGRAANVVITDITDIKTVQSAIPELEKVLPNGGLDVLINNAGITDSYGQHELPELSTDKLVDVIKNNVGSVHAMTAGLLPLLEKSQKKTVLNISTSLGSISKAEEFAFSKNWAYKTSKAAVNMLTRQYAIEYGDKGFTFFLISPGWLKTDLGSNQADLSVDTGVKDIVNRLFQADHSYNGKFYNIKDEDFKQDGKIKYDGAELPW